MRDALDIADRAPLELVDGGDGLADRHGVLHLEGLVGHLEALEEHIEMTLRHGIGRVAVARLRQIENATASFRAQEDPIESDRALGEGRLQSLLHLAVDHRGAVGHEHDGPRAKPAIVALRVENVGLLHRLGHDQPTADIGEGEPWQFDRVDGGERRVLMVGERQHEHRRRGERRNAEAVVLAVGHECLEKPLRRCGFRFLLAGWRPSGEGVVHARRAVEQEHDIGALADARNALAEAIEA